MSLNADPVVFGRVERVFFVRWRAPITDEAATRVMAAMMEARREAGHPLVNISILPPESGEPTPDRSASIQRRAPIAEHLCEVIYVVVPITSPSREKWHRSAAHSDAITRMPVEMCDSASDACHRAAVRLGLDAEALIDEARRRELMDEG